MPRSSDSFVIAAGGIPEDINTTTTPVEEQRLVGATAIELSKDEAVLEKVARVGEVIEFLTNPVSRLIARFEKHPQE